MISLSTRWIISLMGLYSCALMFMQRAGMSVAIVQMTHNITTTRTFSIKQHLGDNATSQYTDEINNNGPEFDWNETLQGIVLGSAFYLYVVVPTVVGSFTDTLGGKWFAFAGVLGPCVLTAITPVVTRSIGVGALIVVQTLMGAFHGCTYPAFFSLYVQWFPIQERSNANAGIQVGGALGNALMYLLAGYLCQSNIGWPSVFYVTSILHVPWLLLWLRYASDRPTESKHITNAELQYITAHNKNNNNHQPNGQSKPIRTPWKSIVSSFIVWCSVLCKMSCAYGYFLLLSKMPSYLASNFAMDIVRNGSFNSIATLAFGVSSFIGAPLATMMIEHTPLKPIVVRKLFQSIGMLGPAVCLLLVSVVAERSQSGTIVLLIEAMFCYGFFTGGEWTVVSEYAPNFAGTVIGFAHILAFAMGIVAPYIVGVIVDSNLGDLNHKWNIIFYITGAVYLCGDLPFLLFGTDQQQKWDKI